MRQLSLPHSRIISQLLLLAGMLAISNTPRAELAGRFFFTPQERIVLNSQRNKSVGLGARGGAITINGLVARNNGKSTVWINGTPQSEGYDESGITVIGRQPAGGKLTVRLPDSSKPVGMRVGQTLETGSGQVREVYEAKPIQDDGSANR